MIVDQRGQHAARFNVIDVAAVVVLFLLIPLVTGAYLLFRAPTPTLVSIVPMTLLEGPNQRLEIDGTNLRPFMRVSFDAIPANSFLLGSTKYALVDVPVLKAGVYDVVLYDYMREVARLPRALTIARGPADLELEVTGVFKAAPDGLAGALKAGDKLPATGSPIAELVSFGPLVAGDFTVRFGAESITVREARRDLSATLLVMCAAVRSADGAVRCAVPGPDQSVIVAPDALLTVPTPLGPVLFQVATARASQRSSGR